MGQQVGAGAGSEATEARPVDACSAMDQGFVSECNPSGLRGTLLCLEVSKGGSFGCIRSRQPYFLVSDLF
jgi:hypothetical protein